MSTETGNDWVKGIFSVSDFMLTRMMEKSLSPIIDIFIPLHTTNYSFLLALSYNNFLMNGEIKNFIILEKTHSRTFLWAL